MTALGFAALATLAPHLVALWIALALVRDLRPRRRPKRTKLVCKGGEVVVPRSGKIRARDILGATTCRNADGVSLVLHHKGRALRPIILDLPNDEALATVCRSLGIGHHGFGFVDAAVGPGAGDWVRTASAITSLVLLAAGVLSPPALVESLGGLFALSLFTWVVTALMTWRPQARTIRMTSGGVYVPSHVHPGPLAFRDIERVEATPHSLRFVVDTPSGRTELPVGISPARWSPRAPSFDELAHVAAQIQAAADRAHGKFAIKAEPEAIATMLERGEHESILDWHARIDTIGVGAGGYRSTSADAADLWALLEDPEAKPTVRAAAARLLSRHDKERLRVRVADVLASVRDDQTRTRIADAIEEEPSSDEPARRLTAAR
jgi:hypothetical protein